MKIKNIKMQINGDNILDNISFNLNRNDKVSLVGANGSGKSTLLKIISGEVLPDSGVLDLENAKIGYLKQEISSIYNDYTIEKYIKQITGYDKLENRLNYLQSNLDESNINEYNQTLNEFLAIEGYIFDDKLQKIIYGLSLQKSIDAFIGHLSGGEKMKVSLATVLMINPDVLLLDEPTNNLDIKAIEWLENYLINLSKQMIIVSHDEMFLNNVVNKIFELKNGSICKYNLKYNDYLLIKSQEYEKQKEKYEILNEQKENLKLKIEQAKGWSNKGLCSEAHNDNDKIANNYAKEKTNASNLVKLTKELKNLEIPNFEEKVPIKLLFNFDSSRGNKDIVIVDLICGYDLFKTPMINLKIPFGSKVKVCGGNGSGKTTFIKTILGQIKPISGSVKLGNDVNIGYISQNTLEVNDSGSLLSYVTKDVSKKDYGQIFTLFDKMGFEYEDRNRVYSSLSPGERTRVNIIKLVLDKINVLVFDEVTNHLDKDGLDIVYELINNYPGTIISISHNRKYNDILKSDIEINVENGVVTLR